MGGRLQRVASAARAAVQFKALASPDLETAQSEHVRYEDALVRTLRHKTHALKALYRDRNLELFWEIEIECFSVCEGDAMRRKSRTRLRRRKVE